MSEKSRIPNYRKHKQSGQAIVTLTDGMGGRKDVLLGKFGTQKSRHEYARVIREWEVNGRRLPVSPAAKREISVNELILVYWQFAENYYIKDGLPTSELDSIRHASKFLKRLYGSTPARDFPI